MNPIFARLIEEKSPKLNPHVMNGLACLYMQRAEEYVDRVFRSASMSFPPGLIYHGYKRCTPQEEFDEATKPKGNRRSFDLAHSSLYLIRLKFTYNGEAIPDRFIYLPFVEEGGIFSLGGSLYHITPVLSDKVISPGIDSIFVRLLRDKINFKRCYHSIDIDGVTESSHVIWSSIYRKAKENKKVPITTKAWTCVAHYLFAKSGFTETFRKYAGFVPVVGEEEITETNYPKSDWIICQSSQMKPKTFIGDFYNPNKIRLAIPRNMWNNMTKALVLGFFYVVDHFPHRFKPGFLDATNLWMVLLGHIIFSGAYGENKLYANIQEHFASLDDYVDSIVIEKLRENNYHIENFYDLLALVLGNFNSFIFENESSMLSMYGKSLEVLYYVLYEITSSIFKVNFRLCKLASKRTLTLNDVKETFNKNMKPGCIFGLSNGKIITEAVSYSGDHLYPKVTSKITEQESLPGATRSRKGYRVVGESEHVDISMVEAGSLLFISKSNPTPTCRINPFVNIDLSTGTILPNPKFTEVRQRTQKLFSGKKK